MVDVGLTNASVYDAGAANKSVYRMSSVRQPSVGRRTGAGEAGGSQRSSDAGPATFFVPETPQEVGQRPKDKQNQSSGKNRNCCAGCGC
eukprot:CAMPEP_0179005098 /NCGR_PEP_ID=MMETSP0795-20121207/13706_1 /TAXON_ID=88552 /ORGANISM="Amoebophrya sp., Strain Ameob2" /LENGTH=88 /DNA_ID=CAMNT_0020699503 /DNA_START=1 /DNA_END=267 /DNA_ORIENTATION=-